MNSSIFYVMAGGVILGQEENLVDAFALLVMSRAVFNIECNCTQLLKFIDCYVLKNSEEQDLPKALRLMAVRIHKE